MKVGYARTSTIEQKAGFEAQLRDLKALDVGKIFREQLSSVDGQRAQLDLAIDFCREGDVLVCTKLDRLARSVADLVKIEERLQAKGASICIVDPAMDTSTPNGRQAARAGAARPMTIATPARITRATPRPVDNPWNTVIG